MGLAAVACPTLNPTLKAICADAGFADKNKNTGIKSTFRRKKGEFIKPLQKGLFREQLCSF